MPSVQMNVRIDKEAKAVGDSAFASVGLTPTEVVRDVWGFAQRNRHNSEALTGLFAYLREEDELQDAGGERLAAFSEWLSQGPRSIQEQCVQAGIDLQALPSYAADDYDELLAGSYDEEILRLWGER